MPSPHNLRQSVSWLFLGNTSSQVITFAFGVVLARLLAPDVFGTLVTIQIFTGLAGFVSGGGMGQALVRSKEINQKDIDVVFTLQLGIGCLIYVLFFAISTPFSRWYETPLYSDLLRISALTFITRPFVNVPSSLLYRRAQFKHLTFIRAITLMSSGSVSISLALSGHGIWSLILGGVVGSVVNAIVLIGSSKWRPKLNFEISHATEMARYGFMVSLNDIIVYFRQQTTSFVLGRTVGMSSVGLLNKAQNLSQMPHQFITGSVYQALFRSLASIQDDPQRGRSMFMSSIRLVCVYALPFYVMLLWLAPSLIETVYGPRWSEAAAPLAILSLSAPFMIIENLSGAVLAAHNWLHRELYVQLAVFALTALAAIFGVSGGLEWLSVLLVLVTLYNAIHMYSLASRCIGTRWIDLAAALAPALLLNGLLALVMWASMAVLSPMLADSPAFATLFAGGLCGGTAYVLAFLLLPIKSLASERARWRTILRLPAERARPES